MKKVLLILAVPMLILFLLASGLVGCGLLDAASGTTITLPTQEFDFSVNANQATDALQSWINENVNTPVDISGLDNLPDLISIKESFDIELPAIPVDISNEEKLQGIKNINKVLIRFVQYDITNNSLNFDLPAVEIWLDDFNKTQITESSKKVAQTEAIGAGVTGLGKNVQFTTGGPDIISNYLLGFKFVMLGKTKFNIDTDVSRLLPKGLLEGKIKISIALEVDLL